jgi:hypothetical protein
MKYTLALFITAIACLYSCTRQEQCTDPRGYSLQFYAPGGGTIQDSAARIIQYKKGSNFTAIETIDTNVYLDYEHRISLSNIPTTVNNYDWGITLLPSGKQYRLKDITIRNRSIRIHGNDDHACINGLSYTVNDSVYQYPGATDNYHAPLYAKY